MTLADEHAIIADLLRASRKCAAASRKALNEHDDAAAKEYGARADRMRAAAEVLDPLHLGAGWHCDIQ